VFEIIQPQDIVSYGTPGTVVAANAITTLPALTLSPAFDHVDLVFSITNASATSDATHGLTTVYLNWTLPDGSTATNSASGIAVTAGTSSGQKLLQSPGLFYAVSPLLATGSAQPMVVSIHRGAGQVTTGTPFPTLKNATAVATLVRVVLVAGSADGFTMNSASGHSWTTSLIQSSTLAPLAL